MTGTVDFILRIATIDMDAYGDFYRNKLATLPNISTVQAILYSHMLKMKQPSQFNHPIHQNRINNFFKPMALIMYIRSLSL